MSRWIVNFRVTPSLCFADYSKLNHITPGAVFLNLRHIFGIKPMDAFHPRVVRMIVYHIAASKQRG